MPVAQAPNHLPADAVPRAIVAGTGVAKADHKPVHVTTPGAAAGDQTLQPPNQHLGGLCSDGALPPPSATLRFLEGGAGRGR